MSVNFQNTITVTRYAAGTWTNGTYTAGATSSPTVLGNIQNGSDKLLQNPENGQYQDGLITIRCNQELLTADTSTAKIADRVSWQGKSYEVKTVAYRGTITDLAHYKCTAQLIDANASTGIL
jgi:hypothetical protein